MGTSYTWLNDMILDLKRKVGAREINLESIACE